MIDISRIQYILQLDCRYTDIKQRNIITKNMSQTYRFQALKDENGLERCGWNGLRLMSTNVACLALTDKTDAWKVGV